MTTASRRLVIRSLVALALVLVTTGCARSSTNDSGSPSEIDRVARRYQIAKNDRERRDVVIDAIDRGVICVDMRIGDLRRIFGETWNEADSFERDGKKHQLIRFRVLTKEDEEHRQRTVAPPKPAGGTLGEGLAGDPGDILGWYIVIAHNGVCVVNYELSDVHPK